MSISYLDDIADGSGSLIFLKLLARWKGSLYKLVWLDLLVYLGLHYCLQLLYWFALNPDQKMQFNEVVDYFKGLLSQMPISFLLGFFVSGVIGRWFDTYMYIPWLNQISYSIITAINCADQRVSLKTRLSVMRYLNLSWILMMRTVSDRILNRFKQHTGASANTARPPLSRFRHPRKLPDELPPRAVKRKELNEKLLTDDSNSTPLRPSELLGPEAPAVGSSTTKKSVGLFDGSDEFSIRETLKSFNNDKKVQQTFGKIITEAEICAFESIAHAYFCKTRQTYLPEYWIPIQWAVRLIQKSAIHGNIPDPRIMSAAFNEIGTFRHQLQQLKVFSSLTMPLVYTQVAVIAVYSFFFFQIIATQLTERVVNGTTTTAGMSFPIFSIFYFIFLLGWLKVALCVMNPFGEDYEDFETSEILDYNLDVSYRAVLLNEATYPENLQRATFALNTMEGVENDNLKFFLDSVSCDLDELEFNEKTNDIHNLEIRPGLCAYVKETLFGKRENKIQRFDAPTDIPNPLVY